MKEPLLTASTERRSDELFFPGKNYSAVRVICFRAGGRSGNAADSCTIPHSGKNGVAMSCFSPSGVVMSYFSPGKITQRYA
jgi:hypothetical protein